MNTAYSGTPLAKKLGIKENFKVLLYNSPDHYFDLFFNFPEGVEIIEKIESNTADFIHIFTTSFEDLKAVVKAYKKALKKDGALWISWPKGTSNIPNDLKRDQIREFVLKTGLVDVKVAAIDENWSGLKFVYRLKDR